MAVVLSPIPSARRARRASLRLVTPEAPALPGYSTFRLALPTSAEERPTRTS